MSHIDWAALRAQMAARKALASELAASGQPTRLYKPNNHRALVQPDMSEPGMFRVTRFDSAGPIGHTQHLTMCEAFHEALVMGYSPTPPDQDAPAP